MKNRLIVPAAVGILSFAVAAVILNAAATDRSSLDSGVQQSRSVSSTGTTRPTTKYGRSTKEAVLTTRTRGSTSQRKFTDVPGLSGLRVCRPDLGVSAHVSLRVAGAGAAIRVVRDSSGREVLDPGAVRVRDGRGAVTFAFFGRVPPPDGVESFSVQWRSISGQKVNLSRGIFLLSYGHGESDRTTCG